MVIGDIFFLDVNFVGDIINCGGMFLCLVCYFEFVEFEG